MSVGCWAFEGEARLCASFFFFDARAQTELKTFLGDSPKAVKFVKELLQRRRDPENSKAVPENAKLTFKLVLAAAQGHLEELCVGIAQAGRNKRALDASAPCASTLTVCERCSLRDCEAIEGDTALVAACRRDWTECVRALLQAGASPDSCGANGATSLSQNAAPTF